MSSICQESQSTDVSDKEKQILLFTVLQIIESEGFWICGYVLFG